MLYCPNFFWNVFAGLNDRKGCIFTNDMKLTRQNMKYFCVHIVCNEIQVKVNLEITTFFFYLRFPYCPNFFWFGVVEITITDPILSTLDTVYRCAFAFWHSPCAWVCCQSDKWSEKRSLWRVWFKQIVCVFVQISEGSQHKEQVDRLFLMASRIVSEDCLEYFTL